MHSNEGVADVSLGVASNSKSHINSSASQNDVTIDTPGVLHCGEFRTFWISWGLVNTGAGYSTPVVFR